MKINISSRIVPAYYLEIFDQNECIYSGYHFSVLKEWIELKEYNGGTLRFRYRFDLSEDEKQALLNREDCPEWKTSPMNSEERWVFKLPKWIYDTAKIRSIYDTVIENIPSNMVSLHLFFSESKIYAGTRGLSLRKSSERAIVKCLYVRKEKYKENLKIGHMLSPIIVSGLVVAIAETVLFNILLNYSETLNETVLSYRHAWPMVLILSMISFLYGGFLFCKNHIKAISAMYQIECFEVKGGKIKTIVNE